MSQREIHTRVVGVTFEGRQSVIAQLHVGERVRLCREPADPHSQSDEARRPRIVPSEGLPTSPSKHTREAMRWDPAQSSIRR